MPTFLIIRFSSIGDIVLTTPVIRCLKDQIPDATVHYLTKKAFASILKHNPYVDKLHLLDEDLSEIAALIAEEDIDYVIDLHHNLRSWRVKKVLKTKSFSFPKLNIEKWLITNFKIDRLPRIHIVDRYLSTLTSFGVINDGKGLDYYLGGEDLVSDEGILSFCKSGYIALAIGAAHATKRLPMDRLQELCERIQFPILLLGGQEDREGGEQLASLHPSKIRNACGGFSINQSADLVRNARLVISHDTGLMHIAAAYKKPLITAWGNTIPEFGMYPYYGDTEVKNRIFEVKELSCRPCSKIGYHKCPRKHFKCMRQMDVAEMADLANKWFEE